MAGFDAGEVPLDASHEPVRVEQQWVVDDEEDTECQQPDLAETRVEPAERTGADHGNRDRVQEEEQKRLVVRGQGESR